MSSPSRHADAQEVGSSLFSGMRAMQYWRSTSYEERTRHAGVLLAACHRNRSLQHSLRSYHKGIQRNLSQLQLPFHLSGWHWCKLPSSLEEDEELEESSESLLSFLASLEFPDAATSLDFSDAAYIGLDWCRPARTWPTKPRWNSLAQPPRVHWCSHAKDNEQVALQAEVYKQKYIITRTVFVDKFERWLANHYLGHLLKFWPGRGAKCCRMVNHN